MRYKTLVSPSELAQHIHDPNWVLVDCRHDLANPGAGLAAYRAGHLPGAVFADVERDLSHKAPSADGAFRGRHPLPEKEAFAATLRRWGVNNGSQVVAYDAQGGMFAARLWWMLRWAGHEAVAVLDGGIQAWTDQDGELSTLAPLRPQGDFQPQPSLVRTVAVPDMLANLSSKRHAVIDARAPDRFRGENETLDPVGGHIPGARNRFFRDNLRPDGRFKPAEQLRVEFSSLLAAPDTAIMQCGSGVTACHNLLALEVAGLPGAALYPGSWSEWCADPSRPVATGAL